MRPTAGTVEDLCNLLSRSRLLTQTQVQRIYRQWRQVKGRTSPGDRERFSRWLVDNHYVTSYQAQQLTVGLADHFYLNHYKLLDLIGQGPMAGVFKAVHSLGQIVAIKTLPASKAQEQNVLLRFRREGKMAVRLKHPHIVRTFHLGNASGRWYLVMEHLEGETLEDVLERRKKLPHAEAVRLVHQALLGLQHIHELGMIHRDVAPANLMLVPPRPPGTPDNTLHTTLKILDIGVGRIMFDERLPGGEDARRLTAPGAMLGSALFMAPEQAADAHSADIRADIYSLGCVLYNLLTGQPPFPGKNQLDIIVRHKNQQPRPVRELESSVPERLQTVVTTLLAKDRTQRYATPKEAAQALQPFLASPDPKGDRDSALTQSYLKWVEGQPLEEVDDAPHAAGRWYYSRNGLAVGPFPAAQLGELAASGKLGPADLVWMDGDSPELAIPARAAVDFSSLVAKAKAPGQAVSTSPLIDEMGHDPETGQIFDQAKFKKWQKQQQETRNRELAAAPTVSVSEAFQKARVDLDQWLDLERNRRPIMSGNMEFFRRDPDVQRLMEFYARYGPEIAHKLWHHLQFMVENRRKYYCALG